MKKIFLTLIVSILIIGSYAQNLRIKFEHISLNKGLSQTSVRSIAQDCKGFMWFATLDGLNKYNGYEIITYYNTGKPGAISDNVINSLYVTPNAENPVLWIGTADHGLCKYNQYNDNFIGVSNNLNDSNTLSNNSVVSISGDNDILWIGTEMGLNKWEQELNKWTVFTTKNSEISDNYITCILPDKKGNIWLGTKNGLNFYDVILNKFTAFNVEDSLTSGHINCLKRDIYNNLWIGTPKGITHYDTEKKLFTQYTETNGLSSNYVTSISIDHEGIIWLGTIAGGLNRFDPVDKTFTIIKHDATDQHSLSINNILFIYPDKSNILWIGTSLGGVNKWNRAAEDVFVFRHNPYNDNSLSSSLVRSIFEDKDGGIWLGTVDGGLNKWLVEKNTFINYRHKDGDPTTISQNHVRVIFEDSKDNFWVGTANQGLNLFDKNTGKVIKQFQHDENDSNSISHNRLWRIIEDQKGRIWLATYGGGLNYFDTENFIFTAYKHSKDNPKSIGSDYVTTVYEDTKGRIWVGTNNGFHRFFPEKGEFIRYQYDENNLNSISNNRVYSITEDSKGNIWIGTKGGLNKFLPKREKFFSYTTQNTDFPNNVFMGLLEDNDGNIWGTTNRGLVKFNPETKDVRTYDVRDGLQGNEFLVGSFLKTRNGEFIVGGINGFNAFHPEKITDNQNIPSLVITGFQVSNQELKLDSAISVKKIIYLNHRQTDISFAFVALDYIYPSKNQYAYKLEGYDDDWVYSKFQRNAKYTNLKPKRYIFKVKGSNNDAVWNEVGVEIIVIIKPAFWQTLWFKISSIFFVIGMLVGIVFWRIRSLHRQKRLLKEEVERQTREIKMKNAALTQQKEEIEAQRDEIEGQRDIATEQRDQILNQKKDIEDSIKYAKRIQTAALPEDKYLDKLLPDYFILFRPRDIVSGDFYWVGEKENKVVVIAADCTGHGVPGAFMSMLGISFLNKIVSEKMIIKSNEILDRLRVNVIQALHQSKDNFESKDGMDIALTVINYDTNTLYYSGGNNPLYLIRDKELIQYKGDKMPIAIYEVMDPFSFSEVKYQKNDSIYMFSDGYPDQFGGVKGKKFMYGRFKKLLISISDKPMAEQKQILENTLDEWQDHPDNRTGKNTFSQIDDIVVIGIKF